MNDLVVVTADDWEGLFVNGKLVEEGHTLNEGEHYMAYTQRILERYTPSVLTIREVTSRYYREVLSMNGSFPENLSEVELYDE